MLVRPTQRLVAALLTYLAVAIFVVVIQATEDPQTQSALLLSNQTSARSKSAGVVTVTKKVTAAAPTGKMAAELSVPGLTIPSPPIVMNDDHGDAKILVSLSKNGPLPGPLLSFPVENRTVTSHFGPRIDPIAKVAAFHTGTDFGASCGDNVMAADDGNVIAVGAVPDYGLRIVVKHADRQGHTFLTTYSHLSDFMVSVNDHVSRGKTIGKVGTTGWSTGCHLHFEVAVDNKYVDAWPYLTGESSKIDPVPIEQLMPTQGAAVSASRTPPTVTSSTMAPEPQPSVIPAATAPPVITSHPTATTGGSTGSGSADPTKSAPSTTQVTPTSQPTLTPPSPSLKPTPSVTPSQPSPSSQSPSPSPSLTSSTSMASQLIPSLE